MTPVIVSKDIGTCCQGDISPNKAISPPKPKMTPTITNHKPAFRCQPEPSLSIKG